MNVNINVVGSLKLIYLVLIFIYNMQIFFYSETIINKRFKGKSLYIIICIINISWICLVENSKYPVSVIYLMLISILFIEFLMLYDHNIKVILFGSKNLFLNIVLLRMSILNIFSIIFKCNIYDIIENKYLYNISTIISIILLSAILFIFNKVVKVKNIKLLLKNKEQLKYLNNSLTIMSIYTIITSMLYNKNTFNTFISIVILATEVITCIFLCAILNRTLKIVVMDEYKTKLIYLENELIKNKKNQKKLEDIAFTDELTGIFNRRCAMINLKNLVKKSTCFSVCFVDIDGLKNVNDILGHNEGDKYIKTISNIIANEFYENESVCRIGGDEFLILLPNCDEKTALIKAKKLFDKVEHESKFTKKGYIMSMSYGVAYIKEGEKLTPEEIIDKADKKMYEFKKSRKINRKIN